MDAKLPLLGQFRAVEYTMDVINGSDDEGGCNRRSKIRIATKNNVNIFIGQGCCTEIKEQNTLKNTISYFIPSIFIPKQFRPIEYRALKKIFSFIKNSDNYIGRYSPFRMLTSFDWSLDINSNHRIVTRGRKISKFEK